MGRAVILSPKAANVSIAQVITENDDVIWRPGRSIRERSREEQKEKVNRQGLDNSHF